MEVTLSDGELCEVRRLRLFELREAIRPPLSGEWTYTVDFGDGNEATAEFWWPDDVPPPKRPQGEIPQNGTPRWFEWRDYEFYQAAKLHEKRKIKDVERYLRDVSEYVLANCISPHDRGRVVTADDYDQVYRAALTPELTKDDLERTAAHIFRARFDDIPVLDALLDSNTKTLGEYDPIAVWEVQTMTANGLTEEQWSALSTGERARKVVAHKVDGWVASLQAERDRERRG